MPSWQAGRTPAAAVSRRAFERALRGPGAAEAPEARGYLYGALLSVSFRNSYYNLAGQRCPSFRPRPTPATRRLMQDLGLLFRAEAAGFKVLYDTSRQAGLVEYLRRQGGPPARAGALPPPVWTRLSFILALANPRFVSFTDVPIDLDPASSNFFFANLGPHQRRGQELLLNLGSHATAAELRPTVPVQYGVAVTDEVSRVDVRDLSGEVVLSEPRCRPGPSGLSCRQVIYLDFASLPEDEYTVQQVDDGGTVLQAETVLYTETFPTALGFIDLLFTSPDGAHPDAFPVRGLFGPRPQVEGVDYLLQFERRALPWRYYVVPGRTGLEQPRIEGPAPFLGPDPVTLPDGAAAFRFTSAEALPLLQEAGDRFRLSGRLGPHKPRRVLIDHLPWASPAQVVVSSTPDGPLPAGDMYVYL
jgi:hypothetical protein